MSPAQELPCEGSCNRDRMSGQNADLTQHALWFVEDAEWATIGCRSTNPPDLVSLRGTDGSSIFFLTIPDNRFQDERRVLRFRRHRNEWSLQEIRLDGMTHRLPSAKTKNKLIATQGYSDQKVIAGVPMR